MTQAQVPPLHGRRYIPEEELLTQGHVWVFLTYLCQRTCYNGKEGLGKAAGIHVLHEPGSVGPLGEKG